MTQTTNTATEGSYVVGHYKGTLEEWYVKNQNVYYYFLLIYLTIVVIFSSKKLVVWNYIKDLPRPNKNLLKYFLD